MNKNENKYSQTVVHNVKERFEKFNGFKDALEETLDVKVKKIMIYF